MTSVVYFIQRDSDNLVKIGFTKNLQSRLHAHKKEHGHLSLLGIVKGARFREKLLHIAFHDARITGKWFTLTPELKAFIDEYATLQQQQIEARMVLTVTAEQKQKFRDVARLMGYVVGYGTEKGRGNMSALVRAIADSDVICVPRVAVDAVNRQETD